jgi:hypothetical protein
MNKLIFAIMLSILYSAHLAHAGEYQEIAMCESVNVKSNFPRISVQLDPKSPARAILILYASDGWTQVYSGPAKENSKALSFIEDKKIVSAIFDKIAFRAKISFNKDLYRCDERSFGN